MSSRDERSGRGKAIGEVAGTIIDAVTGLPGVSVLGRALGGQVQREWERNNSVALKAALDTAGMTREDLEELVDERPEVVPLVIRLLHQSAMSGHGDVLRLMGTVVGRAFEGSSSATDCQLILAAIADFTPYHGRVLAMIVKPPRLEHVPAEHAQTWTPEIVKDAADLDFGVALMVLSGLERAGLVLVSSGLGGSQVYGVTPMGHVVIEAMERVKDVGAGPEPQA